MGFSTLVRESVEHKRIVCIATQKYMQDGLPEADSPFTIYANPLLETRPLSRMLVNLYIFDVEGVDAGTRTHMENTASQLQHMGHHVVIVGQE